MPKSINPLFSIITCTYNSEKFLPKNISSVKSQTYKDYEHIFIDGKSTDKTNKIIGEYININPKKIKLISQIPRGISHAMNEGIKVATGKYICILHSDDSLYNKDVLEDVARFFKYNQNLDWIYGKICVVEEDGKSVVGYFPKYWFLQQAWSYLLKFINFIPHQAVFIKKEVFLNHGYFRKDLKAMMDQEYWLRINYKTKWRFFNRIISNYRIHKNAQSSSKKNYDKNWQEYIDIQEKYLGNFLEKILSFFINKVMKKTNKTVR